MTRDTCSSRELAQVFRALELLEYVEDAERGEVRIPGRLPWQAGRRQPLSKAQPTDRTRWTSVASGARVGEHPVARWYDARAAFPWGAALPDTARVRSGRVMRSGTMRTPRLVASAWGFRLTAQRSFTLPGP